MTAPTVLAAARRCLRDNAWSLTLYCPHCHRIHVHGGGTGPVPSGGHRSAHCSTGSGKGYLLSPSQNRWHRALIEDIAWLSERVNRPTTDVFKARARTSIVGLIEDDRGLPGYLRLVDRTGGAAFGLADADVLVDVLGPVARTVRLSAVAHRDPGYAVLFDDMSAPWLSRGHAAAYVERLRAILAAAAVAESAR